MTLHGLSVFRRRICLVEVAALGNCLLLGAVINVLTHVRCNTTREENELHNCFGTHAVDVALLQGTVCRDLMCVWCCEFCVANQMARELKFYGRYR